MDNIITNKTNSTSTTKSTTSETTIDNSSIFIINHHPFGMLDRDQRTILTISQTEQQQQHTTILQNMIEPDKLNNTKNKTKLINLYILKNANIINNSIRYLNCILISKNIQNQLHYYNLIIVSQKTIQMKKLDEKLKEEQQQQLKNSLNEFKITVLKMPLNEFNLLKNNINLPAITVFKYKNNVTEKQIIQKKKQHLQQHQNNKYYNINESISNKSDKNMFDMKIEKENISKIAETTTNIYDNINFPLDTTNTEDSNNLHISNIKLKLNNNSVRSNNYNNKNNSILLNSKIIQNERKFLSKNKNFINFNNKMKLNNLLFCLLICLSVLVQNTLSKPMALNVNSKHHFRRSMQQQQQQQQQYNNNNNDENHKDKCNRILDSFDKIRQQANVAYNEIVGERLNNYVSKAFNLTHEQQHNEWKQTHFDWLYPTGYPNNSILPYDDYTQPIPVEELHHLRNIDRQVLENELIELYKRMNLIAVIAKKIETIIQSEKNAHRKYGSSRNHRSVQDYFQTQAKLADDVIKEVEYAFRQLGLKKPELTEPIDIKDDLKNEGVHWVVTREHLKLLNYVRSAYEKIRKSDCL